MYKDFAIRRNSYMLNYLFDVFSTISQLSTCKNFAYCEIMLFELRVFTREFTWFYVDLRAVDESASKAKFNAPRSEDFSSLEVFNNLKFNL